MMSLMTYACIVGANFLAGCIFGLCVSQRSDTLVCWKYIHKISAILGKKKGSED